MAKSFLLYIIRHAQSANNALPESQRVEDPSITDVGLHQAQRLAHRFQSKPLTHLLTSGFLRAVQTMHPLATTLSIRPSIWTDLHEVGGCYRGYQRGSLEGRPGMTRAMIASDFPEFEIPDDIDHQGWWKSQPYESLQQAQTRAEAQAARLLVEFGDTDAHVACVTHADFKDLLLQALLGKDHERFYQSDLLNTGVTLLRYSSGVGEIVEFNDVDHLEQHLVTS